MEYAGFLTRTNVRARRTKNKNLPECKRGERPIRLVAPRIRHGRSPEVILEDLEHRVPAGDVSVRHYRRYIIMHELSVQTVGISQCAH